MTYQLPGVFLVEALRRKLGDIEKRLGSTSIRGSERATQSPRLRP